MKTKLSCTVAASGGGFSLVELQVVVAVIAIMAAIAVPHVSRITGQARTAKQRANAQHVVSVAAAAEAAGAVFTDVDSAIAVLTSEHGAVVATGTFAGSRYRLSSLSSTELEGAKGHLRFRDGHLTMAP